MLIGVSKLKLPNDAWNVGVKFLFTVLKVFLNLIAESVRIIIYRNEKMAECKGLIERFMVRSFFFLGLLTRSG